MLTYFIRPLCLSLTLVSCATAQTDDRRVAGPAALAPRKALTSFRLHPRFRIELVASEPLVQDPVSVTFDADGAMYVVEYPEFNHYAVAKDAQRQGRVRKLTDANGDGTFDRAVTFAEVPFATAVHCFFKSV